LASYEGRAAHVKRPCDLTVFDWHSKSNLSMNPFRRVVVGFCSRVHCSLLFGRDPHAPDVAARLIPVFDNSISRLSGFDRLIWLSRRACAIGGVYREHPGNIYRLQLAVLVLLRDGTVWQLVEGVYADPQREARSGAEAYSAFD
jgi:hypothetical protein